MQAAATTPAPRTARVQSFLPALLVLVAGLLLVDTIVTALVLSHLARGQILSDWLSFYTAGELVRTGQAAQLYDASVQVATQQRLFGADVIPMGYPLPAFAALLFAPFSKLSFEQSYLVWLTIDAAALALLVRLGWGWLAPASTRVRAAFLASAATLSFVIVALNAQVDLFVVLGLVGCYALLRGEKPYAAGAVLSIALLKPHLVAAVVLLLLVKREWRALGAFTATGGPLLIVPALIMSPRLFIAQSRLLLSYTQSASEHRVRAETMINIRGPVAALSGSSNVWLWLPLLVAIAAVALYVALRVWRERPVLDAQSWALAFVLPLLYSPHMHFQSIVLLFAGAGLYVRSEARVTVEHVLAAFVAVNALWLLTVASVPMAAFVVMGAYALFATRWPQQAAASIDLPGQNRRALAA
jgi:hypothetical protein